MCQVILHFIQINRFDGQTEPKRYGVEQYLEGLNANLIY